MAPLIRSDHAALQMRVFTMWDCVDSAKHTAVVDNVLLSKSINNHNVLKNPEMLSGQISLDNYKCTQKNLQIN